MSQLAPLFTWRSAVCESELVSTTRLVALTLSLHMNERGGSAFPGARLMARETGLSERCVREHLGILVDCGWLEIAERGGLRGQRRCANSYLATVPDPCIPFTPAPESPMNPAAVTPAPDDTRPLHPVQPSTSSNSSRTHKSRPSHDFAPTDEHRKYAETHGLDLDGERAHWLDWCEANGKTYDKLNAGFSTWLRQARAFGRGTVATPAPRRADEVRRCKLCANTGNYVKNGSVTPCKAHVYA